MNRRYLLAGLAALPFVPGAAEGQGALDAAASAALDDTRALPPAAALRRLAGVTATTLPVRLDVAAARAGLAIDARLPDRAALRQQLTARRDAGTPGLSDLPDGPATFALLLQRQLGTIDVAAAQRRLDRRLADLHAQAAPLFAGLGLTTGRIGARYSRLWQDEAQLHPDTPAGRDAAVFDMAATLATAKARAASLVGPLPPESLAVTVRHLSPAEEAAGKQGYRELPAPGRTGAYVVDLARIRDRPRWTLPAVVAHELLPGHMAQLPVEAATPPHALRLDYATAFVEGWGIHAETIALRDVTDPRVRLGFLHWQLFRTGRALADLGIHRHGWSLADARARLVEWQGEPAYFAAFDPDLARIAVEPGVRAAEALAALALDDRAARLTGLRLTRFHAAVLAGGRKRLEQL